MPVRNPQPDPGGATCWWCGAPADSREHKFKRTDLTRAFGRGTWTENNSVAHVSDVSGHGRANSATSGRFKFLPVICKRCNGHASQPMDRAYEQFAEYFVMHQNQIHSEGRFKWSAPFGDDTWSPGRDAVTRYWVKHIATRLAAQGVTIPPGIPNYMNGSGSLTHLDLHLAVRDDLAALQRHSLEVHGVEMGESFWMGGCQGDLDNETHEVVRAWSHWGLGILRLTWSFHREGDEGTTNFEGDEVVLPREWNVDPQALADFCNECQGHRS